MEACMIPWHSPTWVHWKGERAASWRAEECLDTLSGSLFIQVFGELYHHFLRGAKVTDKKKLNKTFVCCKMCTVVKQCQQEKLSPLWVCASPRRKLLTPKMGSKWFTHFTSETVYWSEIAMPPKGSPQQLDWGSNRSLCWEEEEDLQRVEWNRGRHVMYNQVSSSHCRREAPTEGWRSCWLFTVSARSLVKHSLKGGEASDRIMSGC
jgi:hypothetical protein